MSQPMIIWRTNPYTGKRTWTYGDWGGAGWSGGAFTPPGQEPDWRAPTRSKLDEVFKKHDRIYSDAEKYYEKSSKTDSEKTDYWNKIINADKDMLKEVQDLRKNGDLGNGPGIAPESPDYAAGREVIIAFGWAVIPQRELSRDMLVDPSRLYLEGQWRAPDPAASSITSIRKKTATASTVPSPITLDLDGDGIETVSVANGAFFDHAGDGFAERTGWVSGDDGLLARDLNGNGTIDSGRELFGSETQLADASQAAHGFQALTALDSNGDGVIDANDAAFSELRLWRDASGQGRTDAGELLTLAQAGVQSVSVNYTNSTFIDAQGNAHKQLGTYTTTQGQTRAATDVWVQTDATLSMPTAWVEVPEAIASLPDAQGARLAPSHGAYRAISANA